jgi:hypothetical protein
MSQEASRVAELIVAILQESPNKSLLGSNLSIRLKSVCPEFMAADYGLRNLREFLRTHVPAVYESSRQGLDFIYTLSPPRVSATEVLPPALHHDDVVPTQVAAARLDDELWKTYVSPNSPYRLFMNDATSEFRVVGLREDAPPPPWVQVPPCPASRHRTIAEEFVATLTPGEPKTRLDQILSAEKVWWIPFFEATRHLGIEKLWLDFRRGAVYDELGKTLTSLGISPSKLPLFRQHGRSAEKRVAREPTRSIERLELRRVALSVVGRLPEAELRELRFRLGDLIDALGNR